MTPEQLSAMCRCGHARRKHKSGNIFESYSTQCHEFHRDWKEGPDCWYFEPDASIVVLRRAPSGRFVKAQS